MRILTAMKNSALSFLHSQQRKDTHAISGRPIIYFTAFLILVKKQPNTKTSYLKIKPIQPNLKVTAVSKIIKD